MKTRISLLALWLLLFSQALGQQRMNFEMFKRDTQIFESIVEKVLKQDFDILAVEAQPQASYLEGYGVLVSFRLKINRTILSTPFGEIRNRPASSKTKAEKIALVKERMIGLLADYGNTIKQLSASDHLSIAAHIEDRNELDESKGRKVIIFSVQKDDLDLYVTKKIELDTFGQRVSILEY